MFCNKCGNPLQEGMRFCAKCGQPAGAAAPQSGGTFVLTVNRDNQWFLINPSVTINIDGTQEHKLPNGMSIDIPVTPGPHRVTIHCGIRSNTVDINVASNLSLNTRWNRVTGALELY